MALTRRAWTGAAGVVPIVGVASILAAALAAALVPGPAVLIVVLAVVLVGGALGLLLVRHRGAEGRHRRVAAVRDAWAAARPDAVREPDGAPDARDVALALPRGWRVESARGRVRFEVDGAVVHAETWVLRAAGGSRRDPRRREVVVIAARTGAVRAWLPIGASVDPLLVAPSWGDAASPEPSWMPAVRERTAAHEDLLAALSVGDDRVVLFALDDPRPQAMLARARLVRDVAARIG
ncbi:hypothetical protein ACFWHT_02850 [Microbacterium sp. NPDC058342]|uniref:hypothetical protein n=1 Tax=Microbacterium sp. NPDC058342 TaxID=3346454 RepID=UPI003649662C